MDFFEGSKYGTIPHRISQMREEKVRSNFERIETDDDVAEN